MKRLTSIFLFLLLVQTAHADFSDMVDIYKNGELVWSTDLQDSSSKLSVSIGDTLVFKARTDWDLLLESSLQITDAAGAVNMALLRIPNNSPGADFTLIVDEKLSNQTLNFRLHYDPAKRG